MFYKKLYYPFFFRIFSLLILSSCHLRIDNNAEEVESVLRGEEIFGSSFTELDSVYAMRNWIVGKVNYLDYDLDENMEDSISKFSNVQLWKYLEESKKAIYKCTSLSDIYKNLASNYGFNVHLVYMGSGIDDCGHTLCVVKSRDFEKYYLVDVWGQYDLLTNADLRHLDYFEFIELLKAKKYKSIYFQENKFEIEMILRKEDLGFVLSEPIYEAIISKNWDLLDTYLEDKNTTVLIKEHAYIFNTVKLVEFRENKTNFLLEANFSFVSKEWRKHCQEYTDSVERNYLDFYLNVTHVDIDENDLAFKNLLLKELPNQVIDFSTIE